MSTPLIPRSFYFRVALSCPRLDGVPRSGKGRLLDLPESCRLPELCRLDGREPWAEVRTAWNASGLGLAFEVTGKPGPIVHDPVLADASDGVQVWIDTRDTRNVHRATRFCHRYSVVLVPSKGTDLDVKVALRPIHRAQADPPKVRADAVVARADRIRKGWRLEVFFPAESLHGFDPETNRRLGFCYQVTDPDRGDQFLGVGRDFPVAEDPSLWATLELRDEESRK
jgi:hypothetical protein